MKRENHSSFIIHSPFIIHHSSFIIHHSPLINHHSSLDTRSHFQHPQQIRQQTPSRKYFCSHHAHASDVSHLLPRQHLGIGEKSSRNNWKSTCRANGNIAITKSAFDVSGVRRNNVTTTIIIVIRMKYEYSHNLVD